MTKEYCDYLAHYGVKGQKWGVRNWQNSDGTYTEAGKNRYGWGYGRQPAVSPMTAGVSRSPARKQTTVARASRENVVRTSQESQAEIEARKARTKKILAIAGGVALAAALGYGAYKGGKALKNWAQDARIFRYQVGRNKMNMEWSRFESMRNGGWSKTAEKSYRRNVRNMDNAILKSYFTRHKHWY